MWFTDAQMRAIPALADCPPDVVPQAAADAGALYQQITANPGVDDTTLRVWAESAGILPEAYNRAVAILGETGQAFAVSPGAITPLSPLPASSALQDLLVDRFTAAELQAAATRAGADVPKSATKQEVAAAIAGAGAKAE